MVGGKLLGGIGSSGKVESLQKPWKKCGETVISDTSILWNTAPFLHDRKA